MNIALCTLHNDTYSELASITLYKNKTPYCEKHKYDLIFRDRNFETQNFGFEKINIINKALNSNKYDWVMWLGCDALITNHCIRIEDRIDENYDLIISSDSNWKINADSFIIKNSENGKRFLNAITESQEEYIKNEYFEQAAMINFMEKEWFKNSFKIVPQKMLNSYNYYMYPHIPKMHSMMDFFGNYGAWEPGDFVLHWPGVTLPNRLFLAKKYLQLVRYD